MVVGLVVLVVVVVVVYGVEVLLVVLVSGPQSFSSEPSLQSGHSSHAHAAGMQFLLLQVNWPDAQVEPPQSSSSEPSLQSVLRRD